ncbi:unnamed protein product [Amoebophrya sp. A120]|nr:unnamed protein product [Amoebophrya sp. A120]|eukprot:GSA120T00007727001.1
MCDKMAAWMTYNEHVLEQAWELAATKLSDLIAGYESGVDRVRVKRLIERQEDFPTFYSRFLQEVEQRLVDSTIKAMEDSLGDVLQFPDELILKINEFLPFTTHHESAQLLDPWIPRMLPVILPARLNSMPKEVLYQFCASKLEHDLQLWRNSEKLKIAQKVQEKAAAGEKRRRININYRRHDRVLDEACDLQLRPCPSIPQWLREFDLSRKQAGAEVGEIMDVFVAAGYKVDQRAPGQSHLCDIQLSW